MHSAHPPSLSEAHPRQRGVPIGSPRPAFRCRRSSICPFISLATAAVEPQYSPRGATREGRRHTDRHVGRTGRDAGRCVTVAVPALVTQPLHRLLRSLPSPQAPLTYPALLGLPMQAHSCRRRLAAYLSTNQGQRPPPWPLLPNKPRRRSPSPPCTKRGIGTLGGNKGEHAAESIATHAAD